jgi:hypothetical protein
VLYTLIILHFELIEFHLEQLIFLLTDLFVTHMDFIELHPHFMGGFQSKDPIKQLLIEHLKNMISSTRIPLSLTLCGNSRQLIHGSAPSIMVLSLKVACHSMFPKGKLFPRQHGRAIAATFPHLSRRLSQATREPSSDTTCSINGPYKGGEYETSFSISKTTKRP